MREKVVFEPNVPQVVTLEFDDGQLSEGLFGQQYQYFCGGNRVMWLDPEVREKIRATGAAAGDQVAICKRTLKKGNRRKATWEVELVQDETGYTATDEDLPGEFWNGQADTQSRSHTETAFGDGRPGASTGHRRGGQPQQAQQTHRPQAQQAQRPVEAQPLEVADAADFATRRPAAAASEPAADYTAALRAAVDAAVAGEAYAASRGLNVRFSAEDLRAIAAALYIHRKEGK